MAAPIAPHNGGGPGLTQQAIARNDAARAALRNDYDIYDQGSTFVIQVRAQHAAAQPGVAPSPAQPGAGEGTNYCSICQKNKKCFARHMQEIHVKDPGLAWFCPHCGHVIFRTSDIEYDVHLTGCQLDFRGRHGQAILWDSTEFPVLTRFPKDVLVFLAQQTQPRVDDLRSARIKLRNALSAAGLLDAHPDLRDMRWPMRLDLNNPTINPEAMNKHDLCLFIKNVRLEFQTFHGRFDRAEGAVRIHQQTSQLAAQNLLPAAAPDPGPSALSPDVPLPGLNTAPVPHQGLAQALQASSQLPAQASLQTSPESYPQTSTQETSQASSFQDLDEMPLDPSLQDAPQETTQASSFQDFDEMPLDPSLQDAPQETTQASSFQDFDEMLVDPSLQDAPQETTQASSFQDFDETLVDPSLQDGPQEISQPHSQAPPQAFP